jgi:hypothetical protein
MLIWNKKLIKQKIRRPSVTFFFRESKRYMFGPKVAGDLKSINKKTKNLY